MSAVETLTAIARGERPESLLHTCRLATDAGEAYGIEAVSAHFRAAPLAENDRIGSAGTIALIADATILFADAYDANIARIWRVGSDGPVAREQRVDVAFDSDMTQARGDIFVSPSDFPAIDADVLAQIADAGRAALDDGSLGPNASRSRLFLLRVASDGARQAALFAHHTLALGPRESAGFRYAAVLLGTDAPRWFIASGPAPAWTPRV